MKIITKEQFRQGLESENIVLYMIDSCIINGNYYKIETNDKENTVTLERFEIFNEKEE